MFETPSITRHGVIRGRFARHLTGLGLLSLCGVSTLAAATLCVNPGGKFGCKSSISAAVAAASPGETIQVAKGTYKEQVVISKSLSLIAQDDGPTIDATGLPNGIFVTGMSAAPNAGVADVLISGFNIRNANFEGVLVANASDVTLVGNHVHDNNKALDISTPACPGLPPFETNEAEDCGEGIHLMAVDHSLVVQNESDNNSGGVLITDETGPNHDNVISDNYVHDNPFDCGITIASHGPATSVIPSATLPYGITRIKVAHNDVARNGYQVPGAGAGVGIFAPFPGTTASANVVIDNDLHDNGLPGVTMHNHAAFPMAPPVNMNDNVIVSNRIHGNGQDTLDAATSGPTGINLFSVAPVTGTVVSQNWFDDEAIDLAFNAPSGQINAHLNNFDMKGGVGVDNIGAGTVNATFNWWNCSDGPGGGKKCASVVGSGVVFTPWLTAPFDSDHH